MKCIKNQYMSPLSGSVYCEAIAKYDHNGVDFNAEGALNLYNRHNEFQEFLSNNIEDLVNFIPKELKGIIVKAEFGHTAMQDDKLFLLTEIYTTRCIDSEENLTIRQWILGQMCDGWGESLAERCIMSEQVNNPTVEFDPDTGQFVSDEGYDMADYYLCPGGSITNVNDIQLLDSEEVELEIIGEPRYILIQELQDEIKQLSKKLDELKIRVIML